MRLYWLFFIDTLQCCSSW